MVQYETRYCQRGEDKPSRFAGFWPDLTPRFRSCTLAQDLAERYGRHCQMPILRALSEVQVFPFIIQALLDRFSYKAAVISLGLGYFAMGLIAVLLIKERVPIPKRTKNQAFVRRKVPFTFLKRNTFWLFTATIALTSLGNFLPSIYLPSYAADLGLSTSSGTLLVSIMK